MIDLSWGKNKVYVEYGLLAIGHNLRKVYCQQSGIWQDTMSKGLLKRLKSIKKELKGFFFDAFPKVEPFIRAIEGKI